MITITWDETKTDKYPITPSNDNLTASDWNCLSDDTEILTNVGWVGVDDISTDLDALTYNFDTDELEWCSVTHVHIYDVTDIDMVHIHCRTQSQLVTPNHRVIHKNKYKNTWEMKDGCNVKKHSIMMASSQYNCDDNVYTDEMLKVIAWVITEGSYSVDSNNVTITQSHKKYSNHIADLLDSIGFEYNVHTRDGIDHFVLKSWCSAIIRSHLRHGKTKLTPELLNLNTRQARVFINELVMGDGTFRSSGNSFNYYSNDSSLIDGIQELCIKSGIRAIKSDAFTPPKGKKWYALYCTYTDCSYIRAHEPTIVKYTGRIWCISTANETFVARRQGRPFITGNSMVADQKDRLSKTNDTLDDVPDGTTYVKSTNDYTDADKTKVDYITITTSVDLDSVSTKLDGIDSGATDDQTGDEIVSAINSSSSVIDDDNIASTIARDTEVSAAVESHRLDPDAHHTNVNDPTADQKAALSGSHGTPSASNAYLTEDGLGVANGIAELDSGGKVPIAQLPDSVVGAVEYQGTWDANTNTPTLTTTPSEKGLYYKVSVAGTFDSIDYEVGDWIISNRTAWEKVDNTDQVTSVFGRQGAVVAQSGDYDASQITNFQTTVSANTDVAASKTVTDFITITQAVNLDAIKSKVDGIDSKPKAYVWVPADAAYVPATNPATLSEEAGSTVYAGYSTLDFDDTTEEHAIWRIPMPDYDGNGITIKASMVLGTTPTGDTNVQFNVLTIGVTDAENVLSPTTVDTATNITLSVTASYTTSMLVEGSATITPSNVAAGDLMILELSRDVASDTVVGDAKLVGLTLEYGRV